MALTTISCPCRLTTTAAGRRSPERWDAAADARCTGFETTCDSRRRALSVTLVAGVGERELRVCEECEKRARRSGGSRLR